jgi:transposase
LAIIRSREALVGTRTQLINPGNGERSSLLEHACPSVRLEASTTSKVAEQIPQALSVALAPILEIIASLTERIRDYDRKLEKLAAEHYPETELLRQVVGVGALRALTFVLSLEDPRRFAKSRSVGAYLGLVPGKDQSGERRSPGADLQRG